MLLLTVAKVRRNIDKQSFMTFILFQINLEIAYPVKLILHFGL